MEYHSCNFGLFVTLTYNDDTLPPDGVSIRDMQLFLKRLRKNFDSKTLRYFIISEYGDHTYRWHYHGLLFFNCERKNDIYDIIEKAWSKGFVQFGDIEEGSIVYCTKYCLKGSNVPEGKNPNFRLVSKMSGGIGKDYIEQQSAYHMSRIDEPTLCHWQGQTAPLPRYFREKFLKQLPDEQRINTRLDYQTKLREAREKKVFNELNKLPIHDYFEREDFYYDKLRKRNTARAELYDKHTKKQNIL